MLATIEKIAEVDAMVGEGPVWDPDSGDADVDRHPDRPVLRV